MSRASGKPGTPPPCPCESGKPYAQCCEPFHQGLVAPTPETLMRSRYSAYVTRLGPYLLATWHASTRPRVEDLDLGTGNTRWLGLKILRSEQAVADQGIVEFVARFRNGGAPAVRLHEVSRFVRENGAWYYVDGTFKR